MAQSLDKARQILYQIVATYNSTIWSDPARFRGLLMDLCGDRQQYYEPQINILGAVLEARVVDELQRSSHLPPEVLIPRFTQRLCAKGFAEDLARWAVESWAMALGIIPPVGLPTEKGTENAGSAPFEWCILGATVRGASHVQANKPNQDAILWKQGDQAGLPLMLAMADGHGGEKYIRSHIGVQAAVEIAIEEIDTLMHQLTFPISNITIAKQLLTEELPKSVVTRWQREIEKHWEDHPPTREEWEMLHRKEQLPAFGEIASNPTIPYDATLLAVLITPSFIFYLQLGDGDVVVISESGQSVRLMQADRHLIANNTTSLCSITPATIKDDFRMRFHVLQDSPPALIMLSTDGYSNSFTTEEGFLKVGSDIFKKLCEDGVDAVKRSLPEWLTKTSEAGSGDDISLGLLFRMSTLKRSVILPPEPSANLSLSPASPLGAAQQEGTQEISTAGVEPVTAAPTVENAVREADQKAESDIDSTSSLSKGTAVDVKKPEEEPVEQKELEQIEGPVSRRKKRVHTKIVKRQTIVVSKQGGGQNTYTTISEALENAQPNARIFVEPGTYDERLTITTREVEIIGHGSREQIIIQNDKASCVQMKTAGRVLIQSMTLRGLGKNHAVVDVGKGQLVLSKCNIASDKCVCIDIHSEMANPTIRECTILYGEKSGIVISGEWRGKKGDSPKIERCAIEYSAITEISREAAPTPEPPAIEISHGATASIKNCIIKYNKGGGILVDENGSGKLVEGSIIGNAIIGKKSYSSTTVSAGIEIAKLSTFTISSSEISQGPGNGVLVRDGGKGTIENCTIFEHALVQVEVRQHGELTIEGGEIYGGQKHGILILGNGKEEADILIHNCHIYRNALAGVKVRQGDHLITIKECDIYDGKGSGLLILGKGCKQTIVEQCRLFRNAHAAIEIRQSGEPLIKSCDIYEGHGWGILCCGHSNAKVQECTIDKNAYVGVEVNEEAELHLEDCWISRNMYYGVCVDNKSIAELEKCDFVGNVRGMWDCKNGSKVELKGSKPKLVDWLYHYTGFLRLGHRWPGVR